MKHSKKTVRRHFRIYFKNNHPAYIIDEEGNMYVFHQMTHSKTPGGRTNMAFDNPLLRGGDGKIYIVKKEQRDKKSKFSAFELELKPNVDISFPEIKKVGESSDTGSQHTNSRSRYESSTIIKAKKAKKASPIIKIVSGCMMRNNEMPADFIAVSSNFSPKLPNVIKEANKIDNGNANGTTDATAYTKNSANTCSSTPFPTKSLTCIHTNCISKINTLTTSVMNRMLKKMRETYMSIFLNIYSNISL